MKRRNYRTAHEIDGKGFEAHVEKLGRLGTLQFIHQYETGRSDYTKERHTLLKGVALKKLRAELLPEK